VSVNNQNIEVNEEGTDLLDGGASTRNCVNEKTDW
jgi:hypothetical protein